MIQLVSLSKSFGDRILFDQVTWQISDRERVGLTGPNGSGKTTLLRMLAGLEELDAGTVTKPSGLRVGYLPQDGLDHSGRTLYEEAMLAFQPLLDAKAEMHALEDRLGHSAVSEADHEAMLLRYSDLQDRFRLGDGYSIDLKIATVLRGLGFSQTDFDRPTETFSGGWQMRIALGKLLLERPDLLLLDEPTNHLDLDARNWLETYLNDYPHAVILVSHDRFFLDAVVTRITELNLRTLIDYQCNYSEYLVESQARLERLREAKRERDEEVARMKMFIDRFRYQATKAAQVQSRIKMLDKIAPIEVPPERKKVHFTFPVCARSGRMVFDLRGVRKAYGDITVFRNLSLHIERGDRIALIGRNGSGKSTLMRLLSGVEAPDAGVRHEGHQVVTQYFAQDEAMRLDPALTVYGTLEGGSPVHMVPAIRNILGGFLFSGDDIYKRVTVLSGGERTRLAVARMLLRPSNTLLLDEPTNHLDIDSKDVLLDALMDYGGTLIFVSHDRYFVDRLATKVIDVGEGDAVPYPGTYEEFLWKKEHASDAPPTRAGDVGLGSSRIARRDGPGKGRPSAGRTPPRGGAPVVAAGKGKAPSDAGAPVVAAGKGKAEARAPVGRDVEREARRHAVAESRRRERAVKALKDRINDLEARIADREQAIKEIETAMAAPGFYDNHESASTTLNRHQALMWEVGDLMKQWEELQTTAETS
jgi:ATP-binding cassette subfamily F protein 3